jgi:hypothetical protein
MHTTGRWILATAGDTPPPVETLFVEAVEVVELTEPPRLVGLYDKRTTHDTQTMDHDLIVFGKRLQRAPERRLVSSDGRDDTP